MKQLRFAVPLFVLLLAAACGPQNDAEGDDPGGGGNPGETGSDFDKDGHKAPADCNDGNAGVFPGAVETCNGLDDDCNGRFDEAFDVDLDFVSTCAGDCDDNDPTRFKGATEAEDGIDQDCDGKVDNHLPGYDDDGDGYSEVAGDCDDAQVGIGPAAVEVQTKVDGTPEGYDNDCDGMIDEASPPCDGGLDANNATDYSKAIDLCNGVVSAQFVAGLDSAQRAIMGSYGNVYTTKHGSSMAVFSSGNTAPGEEKQIGTSYTGTASHPDAKPDPGDSCGFADPAEVNDYVELTLQVAVPSNANAFSFDFNFMSAEFPEFVCTTFDDSFIVLLDSASFQGNISFDSMNNPVSINVGFFNVCMPNPLLPGSCTGDAELAGTGFEGITGGGTGWLTTTAPVTPGEQITLRFIIFDEGDHIYDSLALVDNFRWHADPVEGPITID